MFRPLADSHVRDGLHREWLCTFFPLSQARLSSSSENDVKSEAWRSLLHSCNARFVFGEDSAEFELADDQPVLFKFETDFSLTDVLHYSKQKGAAIAGCASGRDTN